MPDEGAHWSDPECVLCSWLVEVGSGDADMSKRICDRCRAYHDVSSAIRVTDPPGFYLRQAKGCEQRARGEISNDSGTFTRLMWGRSALRWRQAAERGYRWIPNTGTRTVVLFRTPHRGAVL